MDIFPDLKEFGIWGSIVPIIVVLAVVAPIWRLSGRASKPSIQSRILHTVVFSAVALVVLCILLVIVGGVVFRIANPGLL